MSRRVFTPKSRKEQLQQQVLMMIRIIRRKLDGDILQAAHHMAVKIHTEQTSSSDFSSSSENRVKKSEQSFDSKKEYAFSREKSASEFIPFDRENARAAVAGFLTLKKDDTHVAARILAALKKDDH